MGRKSSSSLKKKRSKSSSKAKASSKSKSKSGKHKSKKVRLREVSLSSSDYDDSKTLDALASSSSEDSYSYKSKRDRSRSRKDVKGRKKKARKRSYSPDSSEDSLHDRKRKKAKRKREYEGREKTRLKKKIRREASVSSASSGSLSCSTCQSGSASSDDGQYESRRGITKRKEKGKQRLERGRSGSEKSSRYRARSRSSCSRSSESSYENIEENYIGENNSRRLRSVITVAREVEESREFSRDDTKEEILDDHDYPCRSNDSNDGATKRELDHHTLPATEEELRVYAETGDVNADSAWTSESMKSKPSETSGDDVNGEDLESILRKKALENLRKFRGGVQSTAKASDRKIKIFSQVKQPISDNNDVVQGKSNVDNAAVGAKFDNQTFVDETSVPVGRRNLIACPRNNERLNMDKDISGSAKHHLASVPEKVIDADNPSEKSTNYRTNKPELAAPESCRDPLQSRSSLKQKPLSGLPQEMVVVAESSKHRGISEFSHIASHSNNDNNNDRGLSSAVSKSSSHGPKSGHNNLSKGQDEVNEHSQFELKQTSASHEPSNPKLLFTQGGVERNEAKTTQPAIQSTSDSGGDVDELSNSATKSCIESSSLDNNSAKLQDESNQGSQFEQKTMNVMRGGEMVQVSYKVYIPKKAPALARRQLKR